MMPRYSPPPSLLNEDSGQDLIEYKAAEAFALELC
jgi:hypothetical protein